MTVIALDIEQRLLASPAAAQWKSIGIRHHHGIVLPLFSIHSSTSCGIGEYPDLLPLISWCREIGMDVIQLLPLNDIGIDSSPYSALSANGLNPIHLGLSQLPNISQSAQLKEMIQNLQQTTHNQRVNYSTVQKCKDDFLRIYYQLQAPSLINDRDFQAFKEKNNFWLKDYALFKTLKIQNEWKSWEVWPPILKDPSPSFLAQPPEEIAAEMDYQIFVQYLCFQQFEQVKQHAFNSNVHLKGDIPILINLESASVWRYRQFFQLQLTAGAPPDMYAKEGQKWGFPIYEWEAIETNGYRWWIDRLKVASQLYHIYRIDHIVGFYRIWAIPLSRPAKEGHFVPEDKNSWISHGEKIMRMMLSNCDMLPIGEDLGIIPPEVRINLRSLGICGTKVMRWERRWETDKGYIDSKDYPAESMSTVSTHDSETLQQWWTNQSTESRLYAESVGWTYSPELSRHQRMEILRACHHSGSLFHINLLQEYLALVPGMTWSNPEDERINVPGTVSDRNWTYRFHPSVEEIITNSVLKQSITDILRE